MANKYVDLHCHTTSSNERLIDCINRPQKLIQTAFDMGLSGIAITDHESVGAHVKCSKYYKEHKEQFGDFKLIYGNEIYLCRNGLNSTNYDPTKGDAFFHFILLAKDEEGHHQLRKLSTQAYDHSFMRSNIRRVPTYYSDLETMISQDPGHLIGSTACIGGYLGKNIQRIMRKEVELEAETERLYSWIKYINGIFGQGNFYLELQPSFNEEQIFVNKWLLNAGKELNIPAIITTDAHYYTAEQRNVHKAFLNSKDGDREVDDFYATTYLMDLKEIHAYMDSSIGSEVVEACAKNTVEIADKCESYSLERPFKLPYLPSEEDKKLALKSTYPWPKGVKLNRELWSYFTQSVEPSDHVFIQRILRKCNTNPERFWSEKSLQQIETELATVKDASIKQNMVWSRYFLQVADYVSIMWNEGDSLVAPGRGSGVGFYINYLLDITQVDPLKESVPTRYWRFLNPERASILDIDSDCQSNRRNRIIEALQKRYGEKNVVRVLTKKTEASKSAILTAARGIGIDNDIAQYIGSLITAPRGKQLSLNDMYYGNEEEDLAPNQQFIAEMNKYPKLWEVAKEIEGLETNCSSHAGGVIIVDEDFTNTSSMLKLKSGEWVSAYDLHESEDACGQVKIDLLATKALTIIRACLDLLIDAGKIERKSTLRETYEAAIGIYNLDRISPEMWRKLGDNEIINIFEMDTPQGKRGLGLVKPNNVAELTAINSVMRLTTEGGEQPLEKYTRFKQKPEDWEQEMDEAHLTADEKQLLHNYLDADHGLCVSQESMMILLLDPHIAGWPLKQVDAVRKAIAKKKSDLYDKMTVEFYENMKEKGLSENLCHYVWDVLIAPQKSYSFCSAHGLAYSLVALQEMNLAHQYPVIYWNTANLIVDSAGLDDSADEEDDAEETDETDCQTEEEEEEEPNAEIVKEKVKRSKRTVDYGRTAMAIGRFKSWGIQITTPDINHSNFTFLPDADKNTIVYGLRGITNVSSDLIKIIMKNRPYSSFEDFQAKVPTTKVQMVNLIKSGCFDAIEKRSRQELMAAYLDSVTEKKTSLTISSMAAIIENDLLPKEMNDFKKIYFFNKDSKNWKHGDSLILPAKAVDFVAKHFSIDLILNGNEIPVKAWKKAYDAAMVPLKEYIKNNKDAMLQVINQKAYDEMAKKYAEGTTNKWEMESLSFYDKEHELAKLYLPTADFEKLPAKPTPISWITTRKGDQIPIYELQFIAGTVIDKNKAKNTVTLLTPHGVVLAKLRKEQFTEYDKQLSEIGDDGKKHVLEKTWFSKGTLLLVQGIRREDNFILKKYKSSLYPMITKIESINDKGVPKLIMQRMEVDEI